MPVAPDKSRLPFTNSPIQILREKLLSGLSSPSQIARAALARVNTNASRNTYLSLDPDWTLAEVGRIERVFESPEKPPLFGLPVSLKDCFDLAGFRTTAGTRFYAERNAAAREDSAVAARLRAQGAVIVGKTHLHPLAYGITGENRDFADCLQPWDSRLLTGGSTSGGAASVQEGSAVAAIGTDTGGSIRVPAALCGLAGYRASIGLAWESGLWPGGVHLAQSFDTFGWLFRDLRDGPLLAEGLFAISPSREIHSQFRIGAIAEEFLRDCDSAAMHAFTSVKEELAQSGAQVGSFTPVGWDDALSIYAPIQACEAALIHSAATGGDFSPFPPPIDQRLAWGASLAPAEITKQREKFSAFRSSVDALFEAFDFLIMPCSPLSRLEAGKDHSQTRTKILRYTTPLSLAGTPVVAIPYPGGAGIQLTAPRGADAKLLSYAAMLAEKIGMGLPERGAGSQADPFCG
jgi:aspartyl-tRNA(Asn)/glutamyl-tRNA(Gln) amidotransferase subunit A